MLIESLYTDVLFKLLPITLSSAALALTLKDRRPKLEVGVKTGDDWFLIRKVHTVRGWEDQFEGILEVYNTSGRANAIRRYRFWIDVAGGWQECSSQQFKSVPTGSTEEETYNTTPLALPPYSGLSVFVMAFSPHTADIKKRQVKVEMEDLFGKKYSVSFVAYS